MPLVRPITINTDKHTNRYNRMSVNSGLYLECQPFNLQAEVVVDYKSVKGIERFRTLLLK